MTYPEAMPRVHMAHEQARAELAKADTKVTTLLGLVGLAFSGVVAFTTRQTSVPATVALWVAAAPIFASVLVLLSAVRPRLTQFPTPGTWLDAAYNGPAALLEAGSVPVSTTLAVDTALLGGIAVRKYRQISAAMGLLVVGLALLAAALLLAALT
ncbi:Pycsar system effector family protein [Amycolatopsis sp. NPDC051045]|uniref:Pycsar system effector family protein n=1 Tax=Amycolatopsis sp. NPDC051045 TaxID=3156922 RepID=UPI003443F57F